MNSISILSILFYRAALTEMNVLLDVLNIAKEKRYMVLDPVQGEPPDNKMGFHLVAKKKVSLLSSFCVILAIE